MPTALEIAAQLRLQAKQQEEQLKLQQQVQQGERNSGLLGDYATAIKKGAYSTLSSLPALVDIPLGALGLGAPVSNATEALGEATGFQPGEFAKQVAQEYSPGTVRGQQNIAGAEGFWGTAGAVLRNPGAASTMVAESIPAILAGGAIGRAVSTAAARTGSAMSPQLAAGIGEGSVMAAQQAENLRTDNGELTPLDALMSALTGVGGAAVGVGGAKLAQRAGLEDVNVAATQGGLSHAAQPTSVLGNVANIGKATALEGGEELLQSGGEQMLANVAQGNPLMQGVPEAAALGMMLGAGMGGAVQSFAAAGNVAAGRNQQPPVEPTPTQPAPEVPPTQPAPTEAPAPAGYNYLTPDAGEQMTAHLLQNADTWVMPDPVTGQPAAAPEALAPVVTRMVDTWAQDIATRSDPEAVLTRMKKMAKTQQPVLINQDGTLKLGTAEDIINSAYSATNGDAAATVAMVAASAPALGLDISKALPPTLNRISKAAKRTEITVETPEGGFAVVKSPNVIPAQLMPAPTVPAESAPVYMSNPEEAGAAAFGTPLDRATAARLPTTDNNKPVGVVAAETMGPSIVADMPDIVAKAAESIVAQQVGKKLARLAPVKRAMAEYESSGDMRALRETLQGIVDRAKTETPSHDAAMVLLNWMDTTPPTMQPAPETPTTATVEQPPLPGVDEPAPVEQPVAPAPVEQPVAPAPVEQPIEPAPVEPAPAEQPATLMEQPPLPGLEEPAVTTAQTTEPTPAATDPAEVAFIDTAKNLSAIVKPLVPAVGRLKTKQPKVYTNKLKAALTRVAEASDAGDKAKLQAAVEELTKLHEKAPESMRNTKEWDMVSSAVEYAHMALNTDFAANGHMVGKDGYTYMAPDTYDAPEVDLLREYLDNPVNIESAPTVKTDKQALAVTGVLAQYFSRGVRDPDIRNVYLAMSEDVKRAYKTGVGTFIVEGPATAYIAASAINRLLVLKQGKSGHLKELADRIKEYGDDFASYMMDEGLVKEVNTLKGALSPHRMLRLYEDNLNSISFGQFRPDSDIILMGAPRGRSVKEYASTWLHETFHRAVARYGNPKAVSNLVKKVLQSVKLNKGKDSLSSRIVARAEQRLRDHYFYVKGSNNYYEELGAQLISATIAEYEKEAGSDISTSKFWNFVNSLYAPLSTLIKTGLKAMRQHINKLLGSTSKEARLEDLLIFARTYGEGPFTPTTPNNALDEQGDVLQAERVLNDAMREEAQTEDLLNKMQAEVGRPVKTRLRTMARWVYTHLGFTSHIANRVNDLLGGLPVKYIEAVRNVQMQKRKLLEDIDRLLQDASVATPETIDAVNNLLYQMQMRNNPNAKEGAKALWPFEPDWLPEDVLYRETENGLELNIAVDPELAAMYEALPVTDTFDAKEFVRRVMQENYHLTSEGIAAAEQIYQSIIDEETAAGEITQSAIDATDLFNQLRQRKKLLAYPYLPLKRWGKYVVVGESSQLKSINDRIEKIDEQLAKLKDKNTQEAITTIKSLKAKRRELVSEKNQLTSSGADYQVHFVESEVEAEQLESKLKAKGMHAYYTSRLDYADRGSILQGVGVARAVLRNAVASSDNDKALVGAVKEVERLLTHMEVQFGVISKVEEQALRRKYVEGASTNMLRAFAESARAQAGVIARMQDGGASDRLLISLAAEARSSRNKDNMSSAERTLASDAVNEILARHQALMDSDSTEQAVREAVNKVLAFNSMWLLLTSPIYLVQTLMQNATMVHPWLAARFGLEAATAELAGAHKDVIALRDELLKRENLNSLQGLVSGELFDPELMKDRYEAALIEYLRRQGLLDLGLNTDYGSLDIDSGDRMYTKAETKLRRVTNKVTHAARVSEIHARASAALAAYRLAVKNAKADDIRRVQAKASADGEKLSWEMAKHRYALETARELIETAHGDYSAGNAPRMFTALGGIGNIPLQFRKFQLIQIFQFADALRKAFKGASQMEREIARRELGYIVSNALLFSGITGLPAYNALAFVMSMFMGDVPDGDDEVMELKLRAWIGDQELADVLLDGLPNVIGINMSDQLGWGAMLSIAPYARFGLEQEDFSKAVFDVVLGPTGGLAVRMADGLDKVFEGAGLVVDGWDTGAVWLGTMHAAQGIASMLPRGLRDLANAFIYPQQGVQTRNGTVIIPAEEISVVDAAATAFGIPVTSIKRQRNIYYATNALQRHFQDLEQHYSLLYHKAREAGLDTSPLREEWMQVQKYKREWGLKYTPPSAMVKSHVRKRIANRRRMFGLPVTNRNRRLLQRLYDNENALMDMGL